MNKSNTLNVWHEEIIVGKIKQHESTRMSFEYDDTWILNGFPISYQMPLSKKSYDANEGIAHNFFGNLLPEAGARERIIKDYKITNTEFNLLRILGRDCAGALVILPEDEKPLAKNNYAPLTEADLYSIILRKGSNIKDITQESLPRLSLAGAQDKISIFYLDDKYYLPVDAPSNHLIKFEITEYKNIPLYECFLSYCAKKLNLPSVDCELKKINKHYYLLINRYDRIQIDGHLKRLHQEDFCQALGISYIKKYENDGGPSFHDCLNLIQDISTMPLRDSELLLKWQIFNFLAGNSDGHAKNISILYHSNKIQLAPFYDLVCTRAIDRIDRNLALSIGGEYDPNKIKLKNWLAFAHDCNIKESYIFSLLKEMSEELINHINTTITEFEQKYGKHPALQRVEKVIKNQCNKTLKELT